MASHWHPTSEADIQDMIDQDLLRETHYVDVKREVCTKADSKETARDLASFAIHGGAVLIGVAEDKANRAFELASQPLEGLAEKIENIAAMSIDPPLDVIPHEIEAACGEGKGYLFVEVRPSVHAPHMVDGVYYGRGEKTRTRLTDAQVVHLHSLRQSLEGKIRRLLEEEVARDPIPLSMRENGHLYLVAYPLSAAPRAARSLITGEGLGVRFRKLLLTNEPRLGQHRNEMSQYPPRIDDATYVKSRAQGVAMVSHSATGAGRTLNAQGYKPEEQMLDIEFRENGSIAALVGRATIAKEQGYGDPIKLILDPIIVAYVVRLVGWTALYSELMGYRGQWAFGIHVNGLRGLVSSRFHQDSFDAATFDAEFFQEVTTATRADLDDRWQVIVEALVGRLTNALQTTEVYRSLFHRA